jgi:hypothetical protein
LNPEPDPAFQVKPDPVPDPGFLRQNISKKTAEEKFSFFLDQRLQFAYPFKDLQATGESFSPQKRTSSTSKNEVY